MFNNHFSLAGNVKISMAGVEGSLKKVKWIHWNGNILFGYTYRKVNNLFIAFASGLGISAGKVKTNKVEFNGHNISIPKQQPVNFIQIWLPIHIGAQYYFTKILGISVAMVDTIGYGFHYDWDGGYDVGGGVSVPPSYEGFTNQFIFKVGLAIKL